MRRIYEEESVKDIQGTTGRKLVARVIISSLHRLESREDPGLAGVYRFQLLRELFWRRSVRIQD